MPLTITHAKSNSIVDWSGVVTVGDSLGGTVTKQASDLVRPSDWNSGHAITLSLAASELASLFNFGRGLSSSSNSDGISAGLSSVGYFEPFIPSRTDSTMSQPDIGRWYFDPVQIPFALGSGQIMLLGGGVEGFKHSGNFSAATTGSVTRVQTLHNMIALYKLGTGASTSRLESIWTADASSLFTWVRRVSSGATSLINITNLITASFPALFDASGGVTYSSTSQSGSVSTGVSTAPGTIVDSLITGACAYWQGSRAYLYPFATTLPPGAYWLAHAFWSTSSSTGTNYSSGTMMFTQSRLHNMEFLGRVYMVGIETTSNASRLFQMFHGSHNTTSSSAYATVVTSQMRNHSSNHRAYWNYAQSSW